MLRRTAAQPGNPLFQHNICAYLKHVFDSNSAPAKKWRDQKTIINSDKLSHSGDSNFVYSAIDALPEFNMAHQRATDKSLQKGI